MYDSILEDAMMTGMAAWCMPSKETAAVVSLGSSMNFCAVHAEAPGRVSRPSSQCAS